MSWIYKFEPLISPIDKAIGFVYLIAFEDGNRYVGKKSLFSHRKRLV